MARKSGEYPNTLEFLAVSSVFRSKIRALDLIEQHPLATTDELLTLANQIVKSRRNQLRSPQNTRSNGDTTPPIDWKDLLFYLRDTARTSFPIRKHQSRQLEREFRLGKSTTGYIKFEAKDFDKGVLLPFGSLDRRVFDALCTLAIINQSPEISIKNLKDFMRRWLGMDSDGGLNYRRLEDSIRRIKGCRIEIIIEGKHVELGDETGGLICRWYLPKRTAQDTYKLNSGQGVLEFEDEEIQIKGDFRVELNPRFWERLKEKPGFVPTEFLDPFNASAVEYDFAKWIATRVSEAKTVSRIKMKDVLLQLGNNDPNFSRWKSDRARQLEKIKLELWTHCNAYIEGDELVVGPVAPEHALVKPRDLSAITDGEEGAVVGIVPLEIRNVLHDSSAIAVDGLFDAYVDEAQIILEGK